MVEWSSADYHVLTVMVTEPQCRKLIANLHASDLHVNLHGQTQVLNGTMTMDNAPPLSRRETGEWEAKWQHESIASRSMHVLSSCQELVQV